MGFNSGFKGLIHIGISLLFCLLSAYNRVAGLKQNITSSNRKALKFQRNVKLY